MAGPRLAGAMLLLLALLPLLAEAIGNPFLLVTATRVMIFAIAVLSLDLILGHGGLVSFGHAAFLGIGAYAVAILASVGVTDLFLQLGAAILASALFALLTGAVSLRTGGVYFIMITLAFGQMAYFFAVSLSAFGGDDGVTLAARSTLLGSEWLAGDTALHYLTLAILAALFLLTRALVASRFGRVLRGARENPARMQAIGFEPYRYRLAAYVIAGAVAGVAGALLANQAEFVSPAYMTWQRSGELIVMAVLGGMGTAAGPLLGAAAFLLLEEWLAGISEHWRLALGVILILVVLSSRGGVAGLAGRFSNRSAAR